MVSHGFMTYREETKLSRCVLAYTDVYILKGRIIFINVACEIIEACATRL